MITTESRTACEDAAFAPSRAARSPKRAARRDQLLAHLGDPVVVAENAPALERQTEGIYVAFKPRNEWQDWLTGTISTIMLRINRCERVERKLRDYASYRAIDFWEDDQALAAEELGATLARNPARVVAKLGESLAGLDWLIRRWRLLARVEPKEWTDSQRDLAENLLGGEQGSDPMAEEFAQRRVEALGERRGRVAEADAVVRGLVEADLSDDHVAGLAGLRRYSRSLHRQLKWYIDQFHVEHPDRWDDPRRRPAIEGPVMETRDSRRPVDAGRFEGAAPRSDETNPTAAGAGSHPRNDETNPTPASATPKSGETKPFSAQSPAGTIDVDWMQPLVERRLIVQDYSNERGKNHSRARLPGETSREYQRRQKAARRRTNLALAELV